MLRALQRETVAAGAVLVAVSKTKPVADILEAWESGQRVFGENYVQELAQKQPLLPEDIAWHFIGHLQRNKVKFIAPFVSMIHGADSVALLEEISRQAVKHNRIIDCLLQIRIAKEETKFGLPVDEAETMLASEQVRELPGIRVSGMMGMATLTEDRSQIREEFRGLSDFFRRMQKKHPQLQWLSMGMTSDYRIALEEGSNMVRIGSAIFGDR